jgi:hypothetical protein
MQVNKSLNIIPININYDNYKHPDGSIDYVNIKLYTIDKHHWWHEDNQCIDIDLEQIESFMTLYNVNEEVVNNLLTTSSLTL